MRQPWYWYVKQHEYTGETSVQVCTAPQGSVKARWWVIPFKQPQNTNYDRWLVYLEPKWLSEGRQYDEVSPEVMTDCEWVFHHREKYEPPPATEYEYTAELCECCGQEIQ